MVIKKEVDPEILMSEHPLSSPTLAERALKRRRLESAHSVYLDLRFLLPTSNCCERLFSIAGHALSPRRRGMLPGNFENLIYLNQNREFWGIEEILRTMSEEKEAEQCEVEEIRKTK